MWPSARTGPSRLGRDRGGRAARGAQQRTHARARTVARCLSPGIANGLSRGEPPLERDQVLARGRDGSARGREPRRFRARLGERRGSLAFQRPARPAVHEFFRADTSDTRRIGGDRLGLALCRDIVESHAGEIGFETVQGAGSTFWFTRPAGPRREARGSARALVIEDAPTAAAFLVESAEELRRLVAQSIGADS
jgi:hypothetical protein